MNKFEWENFISCALICPKRDDTIESSSQTRPISLKNVCNLNKNEKNYFCIFCDQEHTKMSNAAVAMDKKARKRFYEETFNLSRYLDDLNSVHSQVTSKNEILSI